MEHLLMAWLDPGSFGNSDTQGEAEDYYLGVCDALCELLKTFAGSDGLAAVDMSTQTPVEDPLIRREIAHGNLSVVSAVICGALVGRGVLDVEDLLPGLRRMSAFWRERGMCNRALPAELLVEALIKMAKQKSEVDAQIAMSLTAASLSVRRH
jgi:hypothetical protein